METGPPDALLGAAKGGDPTALGSLLQGMRPYVKVLTRAAHRGCLTGRLDESDLVQDAMLEVTRSFDRFEGASVPEFIGWLRRVVSRSVGHNVRRLLDAKKRNPDGRECVPVWEQLPGHQAAPDELADSREQSVRVAVALDLLSADMREVVVLRLVDDQPHAEIARRIGRTEQATRMLFVRSVRRLRELMPGVDAPSGDPS
jgi:RNA polymerase sigma-70 factor (ECF subfamily)